MPNCWVGLHVVDVIVGVGVVVEWKRDQHRGEGFGATGYLKI